LAYLACDAINFDVAQRSFVFAYEVIAFRVLFFLLQLHYSGCVKTSLADKDSYIIFEEFKMLSIEKQVMKAVEAEMSLQAVDDAQRGALDALRISLRSVTAVQARKLLKNEDTFWGFVIAADILVMSGTQEHLYQARLIHSLCDSHPKFRFLLFLEMAMRKYTKALGP
jgi:hypothetical protein